MFDFENKTYLILLLACVVVAGLYAWARASRLRKLRRFGRPEVVKGMMPEASRYKPRIKIVLEVVALAALVLILARPRAGEKAPETSTSNGIEVMIAFDVSNSMLASSSEDPRGTSRLDRARLLLERLIDRLENDKVGLVVFAAEAKTQMPLTTDYYTAKMYLGDLSPALVTNQGTSITDAINLSANAFTREQNVGKAIILITDAEDHEGDAVEAAREAAERGIQVDVVGVGSMTGVPIPIDLMRSRMLTDNNGEVVLTSFNEEAASQIAEAGRGVYVNAADRDALSTLSEALDNLDKADLGKVRYKASAEQFPIFAWLALVLLVADIFVLDRKIGWLKNVNFFTKKTEKKNARD